MHLWVTNLHPRSLLGWMAFHLQSTPCSPSAVRSATSCQDLGTTPRGFTWLLPDHVYARDPAGCSIRERPATAGRRRLAGDGQASSLGTWRIGLPVGLQCCLPTCSLLCLHICCINLTASPFSVQAAHTCPNQRF